MIEQSLGAPKGTTIFPAMIHFQGERVKAGWIFADSYGKGALPRRPCAAWPAS